MAVSMQVIYPITDETKFDYDYYLSTHMGLVGEHMGEHIDSTVVTKGVAGGPDVPPSIHAVATIVFADQAAMNAALAKSGPVVGDIPNFYNAKPTVLFGEVVA